MAKDKTDDKIIGFLRDDARESFVEIGKKLKLSESAVRRRVKNLVDSGVIEKFTVEMGESNTTSAIVLISVDSATDTAKVSAPCIVLGYFRGDRISGLNDIFWCGLDKKVHFYHIHFWSLFDIYRHPNVGFQAKTLQPQRVFCVS